MSDDESQGKDTRAGARRMAESQPYAGIVAHIEASDASMRTSWAGLVAAVLHQSDRPLSVLDIGRKILGRQDDKVVKNFTYPALKRLARGNVVRQVKNTSTYEITEEFRKAIDEATSLSSTEAERADEGVVDAVLTARAEPHEPDAVDFHGLDIARADLDEAATVRDAAIAMAESGDAEGSEAYRASADPADWHRLLHEAAYDAASADRARVEAAGNDAGVEAGVGTPGTVDMEDTDATATAVAATHEGDQGMTTMTHAPATRIATHDDVAPDTEHTGLVDVPALAPAPAVRVGGALQAAEREEVQAVIASVSASLQALRDRKAGESRARVRAEVVRRLEGEIRAMLSEGIQMAEIREAVAAGGFELPEDFAPGA